MPLQEAMAANTTAPAHLHAAVSNHQASVTYTEPYSNCANDGLLPITPRTWPVNFACYMRVKVEKGQAELFPFSCLYNFPVRAFPIHYLAHTPTR